MKKLKIYLGCMLVGLASGVFLTACDKQPIAVTGVMLDKTKVEITIGETMLLKATVTPNDAANQDVKWTSSNQNIATVDTNGKVTAINVGTAAIIVTTDDGGKTANCEVTVNPIYVTGVILDKNDAEIPIGESEILKATVSPSNATYQDIQWISSNQDIATVDKNGKVTALAIGTATITVTTDDGGKTANCIVTVTGVSGQRNDYGDDNKKNWD